MATALEQLHVSAERANQTFSSMEPRLTDSLSIYRKDISGDPQYSLLFIHRALEAEGLPLTQANYETGARIVAETARIMMTANLTMPETLPVTFTREYKNGTWEEGIFEVSMVWQKDTWKDKGKTARLFQFGISADQHGTLVINRVQKHLLDMYYRTTQQAVESGVIDEKRLGDKVWKMIRHHTQYPPELFGFLAASVLFGPHSATGEIKFPTPQFQPEIIRRQKEIDILKSETMAFLGDKRDEQIENRERVIEMIRKRTDFEAMLSKLDIPSSEDAREGFRKTTVRDVLDGIEHAWPSDADTPVYPLRTILGKIHSAQITGSVQLETGGDESKQPAAAANQTDAPGKTPDPETPEEQITSDGTVSA